MLKTLTFAAGLAGFILLASPATAVAQCDISQTKCALNGGKCNIKFKNKTGDTKGSDGGTELDQTSSAQTIAVKAENADKDKVGNKLQIVAGANKTMNIEKKANKDFETIVAASQDIGMVRRLRMSCKDVQAVLNGNGTCKIFHGVGTESSNIKFALGYQCDGGNVSGPKY